MTAERPRGIVPAERRPRVLVIDEEPAIRQLLRVALEPDFAVAEADSVEDAWNILAKVAEMPDVMIFENYLGGENTAGFIKGFRAVPRLRDLPVIVVSNRTALLDEFRALDAGADAFVTKPFSPIRLKATAHMLAKRGRPAERLVDRLGRTSAGGAA